MSDAKDKSIVGFKSDKSLFILGDSTSCDYAAEADMTHYYKRVGFGTKLKDCFDIDVKNLAMSGRSSKSFLGEDNYKIYLSRLKQGDYVIIAFGHNDEKREPERYTDPIGEKDDEGSFKNCIYVNYILPAIEKNADVILCTPTVRRTNSLQWDNNALHIANGGDYARCIRELGKELGLMVIDNTAMTKELYEKMGLEETKYFHAWTSSKSTSVDNTHFNNYGAAWIAYIMSEFIKKSDCDLKHYIKENLDKPKKSELIVNPNYKEKVQAKIIKSSIWKSVKEPWWASVFGDVGSSINEDNFNIAMISENDNISFRIRSGIFKKDGVNNKNFGKIAENSDGMAAVFRVVDAGVNFSVSALANVNFVKTDDRQTSFGLIVLDRVEIDTVSADSYDYIAAAPLKMSGFEIYKGFKRTDGILSAIEVVPRDKNIPQEGDKIPIKITKIGNKYKIEYNGTINETEADFKNDVFAGMFVSRCADITFTDIIFSNEVVE